MNLSKTLTAVFLMAVVTYIPRVLPIAVFKKKLKSRFFRSFLYYVPYAVLGAMTFPSILYSTGNLYSSAIGMSAALVLAYYEQGLMKVAVGAILTVYICGLLL
ncbi:AzlD domain-containing protein [Biomaibacter acetigenes]|jgi:branched-subunit amino acid transport protein|uniref:AzlD domain-containing protein n=1 Tax=Biomaibacter acetigenes TaxID=2316383 RepID=A0A3G2R1F7_9FIRM|nr:AzlD domain-containing protein [Biomaibacter acetigenes]RKL64614.1 AzlD domain-containing protein [Thermoanaerobacteraceae bacterium SP2]